MDKLNRRKDITSFLDLIEKEMKFLEQFNLLKVGELNG